jgi:hypothetical protein
MGESNDGIFRADRLIEALERGLGGRQSFLDTELKSMILEQFKAKSEFPDTAVFCGYSFYDPNAGLMVSPSGSLALFVEGAFFFDDFPKAFLKYKEVGLQTLGLIFAAVWKDGDDYLVLPVDGSGNALPTIRRPSCKTLFKR